MLSHSLRLFMFTLASAAAAHGSQAHAEQVDRLFTSEANAEYWRISEPDVQQRSKDYPQITFAPGDRVVLSGGGCVQTGGSGATWKLYINPDFGSSVALYHGQIKIPGLFWGLTNLSDIVPTNGAWSREYTVSQTKSILTLGYVDDGYGDNGYWGHDDGTGGQCKNSVNAYLNVYIRRAH